MELTEPGEKKRTGNYFDSLLSALKKEYAVVGKKRVKNLHAWLLIGFFAGIAGGAVFVSIQSEAAFSLAAARLALISNNIIRANEKFLPAGALSLNEFAGAPGANFSPQFLVPRNGQGPEIYLGMNRGVSTASLPRVVAENANILAVSDTRFILALKQKPLAAVAAPFNRDIAKALLSISREKATSTKAVLIKKVAGLKLARAKALANQLNAVLREQQLAAAKITATAPSTKIRHRYSRALNGFALTAGPGDVARLKKAGFQVKRDSSVKTLLMDSVPLIGANQVWKITDKSGLPITGKGVTIAIIDTGVDYTHSDLGGCFGASCKVIGGYDFVNGDGDPMDDMGHGTHVGAIAAGNGVLKGVAPDASVLAYKVLDQNGSGYISDVIAGIDRALDPNQDGDLSDATAVISMSLGGGGDPDDPVSQSVDNAVNAGSVVAVAAGNSGPGGSTIASPGVARLAITIAATTKQDSVSSFSSRGPVEWNNKTIMKPDVAAPGESICAAEWDGWLSDRRCLDDLHIAISGTSMATPHVAGTVALLRQAFPEWTPAQIKAALKNTARDIGFSPLDRGAGRIDALAALSLLSPPPVAALEPISASGITRQINGSFDTAGLQEWALSYQPVNAPGLQWVDFVYSKAPPGGTALGTLNTQALAGRYLIRLRAVYTNGSVAIDYGYALVSHFTLSGPLNADIYRVGDIVPINVVLETGLGSPVITAEYSNEANPGWNAISSATSWNTSGLATGWYGFRLTVAHDGISEQKGIRVYLDEGLIKGWPQRIPWDACPPSYGATSGCFIWPGMIPAVVSDLDGNGSKKVIIFSGGNPPKVRVYRSDGSLVWTKNIGTVAMTGASSYPIVADLDGDGKKEIVAYNINDPFGGGDPNITTVYAFRSDGTSVPGWPVNIPKDYLPTMAAADIDGDGKTEIVVQGNSGNGVQNTVSILSGNGAVKAQWSLPSLRWFASLVSVPAIANMDSDPEKEIVIARLTPRAGYDLTTGNLINEGEIHVFDSNGQEQSGWPKIVPGVIFGSPAVGDIDKDGINDIVVGLMYSSNIFPEPSLGGLYAFDASGNIKNGWPVMQGWNYWSSPSLSDFDGDGKLEIVASRLGFNTDAFTFNGTPLAGWPQSTCWQDYYGNVTGNVSGGSATDIVTTAGAGEFGNCGVYAWSSSGATIPGFPKLTESDAQAPAVIAGLESNGNTDVVATSDYDYDSTNLTYKFRSTIYAWGMNAPFIPAANNWPTFHHDEMRSGAYGANENKVVKLPDLAVISASSKKAGLVIKYTVTVSNPTKFDIPSWTASLQDSNGKTRTKTLPKLSAGATVLVSGSASKYPLTFTADPKDAIKETNENNNVIILTSPAPQTASPASAKEIAGP